MPNSRPQVTQPFNSVAEALQALENHRAAGIDPQDMIAPNIDPRDMTAPAVPQQDSPAPSHEPRSILKKTTKVDAPASGKDLTSASQTLVDYILGRSGSSGSNPLSFDLRNLDPKTLMLLGGLVGGSLGSGAGYLSGKDEDKEGKGGTRLRNSLIGLLLGSGLGVGGAYLYKRLQQKGAADLGFLYRQY